jgi:hypothetical protein
MRGVMKKNLARIDAAPIDDSGFPERRIPTRRKPRDECRSMEWFRDPVGAKIVIENRCGHLNENRSDLG